MFTKHALIALSCLFVFACAHKDKAATTPAPAEKKAEASTDAKATTKTTAKAKAEGTVTGTLTCTRAKDVRTVKVEDAKPGCKVWYSTNDKTPIATAKSGTDYCQKVSEKISKNLTAAGFTCQ